MGRTDHPSTHLSTLSPPVPAPIVADVVLFDLFHKNIITATGRERETVNSRERKKRENKI
jgi:hypothetical protein